MRNSSYGDSLDVTRRAKAFKVPYQRILEFLNQVSMPPIDGMFILPKALNLPDGYRVLDVFNDELRRAFVFLVCHPSWPVTLTDSPVNDPIVPTDVEWRKVLVTAVECT